MILTRGGTILPLDQRIADALMAYAMQAADAEGVARQTWCRRTWKLKDYEAKDLLKGNASKALYERILKLRGPHCGWFVGLAVTGAVVGQEVHEFFREQMRLAAKEAARAHEHDQLASAAWERLAADHRGSGQVAPEGRAIPRTVGAETARRLAD